TPAPSSVTALTIGIGETAKPSCRSLAGPPGFGEVDLVVWASAVIWNPAANRNTTRMDAKIQAHGVSRSDFMQSLLFNFISTDLPQQSDLPDQTNSHAQYFFGNACGSIDPGRPLYNLRVLCGGRPIPFDLARQTHGLRHRSRNPPMNLLPS